MKRQTTEQEKISEKHVSDKGLISRIYKELSKLTSKITSNPIRTQAKDNIRHFTEEVTQMANSHTKRCLELSEKGLLWRLKW